MMRPQSARLHAGQSETDQVERGRQIDRERFVPFLRRKIFDRRKMPHHGVVHENIDAADALLQVRHHGLDGGALRQVGGDADRLDAILRAKAIPRRRRLGQIVQDNIGARAGKAFGHGEAEACRCPGHERPFVLQHRLMRPGYFLSSSANTSLALRKASTPAGTPQ